jgi:peroxiredoxin
MIPRMVGQTASPGNAGLTLDQWRAWQWLRVHLREERDRWTDRALVHLRFLRWLTQSGRRRPAEGRPRHRAVRRGGLRKVSGQMDGRITPIVPLPVGTLAPDFTLAQTPVTGVALSSLRGHPVVLVFYPMDWEPVSREQLSLYQDFAGEFDRFGARLLGLSIDHAHSHEAFARDARIGFPLLADFQPRGAVARKYGVYRARLCVSARALFVLDGRRRVRFSRTYPDALNPGVDDVLTTLEAMDRDVGLGEGG